MPKKRREGSRSETVDALRTLVVTEQSQGNMTVMEFSVGELEDALHADAVLSPQHPTAASDRIHRWLQY